MASLKANFVGGNKEKCSRISCFVLGETYLNFGSVYVPNVVLLLRNLKSHVHESRGKFCFVLNTENDNNMKTKEKKWKIRCGCQVVIKCVLCFLALLQCGIVISMLLLGSFSARRFWATDGNWKWTFRMPGHWLNRLYKWKRYLAVLMWLCEDKLNWKTAHFRLPFLARKRYMLKLSITISFPRDSWSSSGGVIREGARKFITLATWLTFKKWPQSYLIFSTSRKSLGFLFSFSISVRYCDVRLWFVEDLSTRRFWAIDRNWKWTFRIRKPQKEVELNISNQEPPGRGESVYPSFKTNIST